MKFLMIAAFLGLASCASTPRYSSREIQKCFDILEENYGDTVGEDPNQEGSYIVGQSAEFIHNCLAEGE